MTCSHSEKIHALLKSRTINSVFQPIVDLRTQSFLGVEALTRGPADSALYSPAVLFPAAEQAGVIRELELLALETAGAAFSSLALPAKLFVNISPMSLMTEQALPIAESLLARHGLLPENIVLELSEQYQANDVQELAQAIQRFTLRGFGFAVDDLGAGYAGLKVWTQLQPDFVKIDRHFISGIDTDPIKREFVRSILAMAHETKSRVIAEGIETDDEANTLRELGVRYVQGYLFGRPEIKPVISDAIERLTAKPVLRERALANRKTIGSLLQTYPSIDVNTRMVDVVDIFKTHPDISSLPVLLHNAPVGLITRHQVLEIFSERFGPELHGRKPVAKFMNEKPVVVDSQSALEDVSYLLTEDSDKDLIQDFIVADGGAYRGIAKTSALLRAITDQQISSARHANPLTQLPGNVPINEQVNTLIASRIDFWVDYCDIDSFKAFNDVYGYAAGDKAIVMLANILGEALSSEQDFIGHIGGDDFLLLLRSADALGTCSEICELFSTQARALYDPVARANKGFWAKDRQGNNAFFPLMSLSIGMVHPDVDAGLRADDISALASEAKKEAKRLPGGGVFASDARFPGTWRLQAG